MKLEKITVWDDYWFGRIKNPCFKINIEERCEPSIPWQRNRKSNRFCPDINDWQELDTYEIGEGGGFDLDTLGKLIPQNMSMEKIIGGVVAGIITAGVGGKRSVNDDEWEVLFFFQMSYLMIYISADRLSTSAFF